MIFRHACLARILFASALALSLPLAPCSSAAPPPNQAPQAPAGPERGAAQAAQRTERQKKREAEREKRSQNLRRVMTSMGFGDRALQDEVLGHIAVEVRERGQVRRKGQGIYNALRDPRRTDEEVRTLLHEYHAVVEADHARRRIAEDALDERIDFRSNPRLEAMLILFGAIGDAPIALPPVPRAGR